MLSGVIRIAQAAGRQLRGRLAHHAFQADREHFFILNGHMPHTVIKIIARREHIMFHGAHGLRSHIGKRQFAGGLSFPISMYLLKLPLRLLRNPERIRAARLDGVKLRFQPLPGKLREGLAAPGRQRRTPYDQFVLTDNDRNLLQDMGKGLRPSHDDRFAFRLAVTLRQEYSPGRFNLRHIPKQRFHQPRDPLRFGGWVCVEFPHIASIPFFLNMNWIFECYCDFMHYYQAIFVVLFCFLPKYSSVSVILSTQSLRNMSIRVTTQSFAYTVPSPLLVTPGSPSMGIRLLRRRVRLNSFPANHFKNWLFLGFACGRATRMAAKLRPYGASNNAARACG